MRADWMTAGKTAHGQVAELVDAKSFFNEVVLE